VILGQRIRLEPNNVQRTFFERCAGTARFTYNWGLARWKELYEAGEKTSWQKLNAELNARKATEFPWMTEIPWAVTNNAIHDLGNAFTNFFRRLKTGEKPGYPRFKKRGRCREGFAIETRALRFDGRKVRIPKLGWVRVLQEPRFPGKMLSARFTEHAGHWYLSVQIEVSDSWVYPHRCENQATVGVDLGLRDLAVLSTGEHIPAPRSLRGHEMMLRRLNKELSRRTRGGKNWMKTKATLSRLHERIANIRQAVTHELTASLVRNYRTIVVEDLNVRGMTKNRHLAKSVADASMSEVRRQLAYKVQLAGCELVVADRWYPSSKRCSVCGVVLKKLPLGRRHWTCECGAEHDRDENAAKNLKALAAAHAVTACCPGSSGLPRKTKLLVGQESSSYVNQ
jgi:putative transposase